MRAIEHTRQFRRDYKREKKGRHGARLDAILLPVIEMLASDTPLPSRYRDQPLAASGAIIATAMFGRT
jgi:mRNA interferase YafQ